MGANDIQHGGTHYNEREIQHWDIFAHLPYCPSTATKYLSRWRSKGGELDLKKAQHYLDKSIEMDVEMPHIDQAQMMQVLAYCDQLDDLEGVATLLIIDGHYIQAKGVIAKLIYSAQLEAEANGAYVNQD